MSSEPEISGLTDHLGYWLRLVSNHVSTGFARRLEAEGVTVAEWVVLRILFDAGKLAPSRLASRMGMTRGAISKLAGRLLAKRLVERSDSPDDARAHTLRLTGKGRSLVPRLAQLADANDESFFGVLPSQERKAFAQTLQTLVERHGMKDTPVD